MPGKRRIRTIAREFMRAQSLKNGDVVLVRKGVFTYEQTYGLSRTLMQAGFDQCVVVVVEALDDLQVIPLEEMEEHGWTRLPSVSSPESADSEAKVESTP